MKINRNTFYEANNFYKLSYNLLNESFIYCSITTSIVLHLGRKKMCKNHTNTSVEKKRLFSNIFNIE